MQFKRSHIAVCLYVGPSINDVTHLWGRGDLPKGEVTPQAYLVKWVTRGERGQKSQKMSDVIYGWDESLNPIFDTLLLSYL